MQGRTLLNDPGFCLEELMCDQCLLSTSRQHLQDTHAQGLRSRLDESTTVSLYKNICHLFCYKQYLDRVYVTVNLYNQVICILPDVFS